MPRLVLFYCEGKQAMSEKICGLSLYRLLCVAGRCLLVFWSDDDDHVEGVVVFGEVVFERGRVMALPGRVVDEADEGFAVLVCLSNASQPNSFNSLSAREWRPRSGTSSA